MAIEMTTARGDIEQQINEYIARKEQTIIRTMLYAAEEITNAARQTNSYKDQTGNLRSSLGCIVAVDGQVVGSRGFEAVKDGQQGADSGQAYAEKLLANFSKGIVLLAVAGMNYAAYVSARGLDVLDTAELTADKIVPMYLQKLGIRK